MMLQPPTRSSPSQAKFHASSTPASLDHRKVEAPSHSSSLSSRLVISAAAFHIIGRRRFRAPAALPEDGSIGATGVASDGREASFTTLRSTSSTTNSDGSNSSSSSSSSGSSERTFLELFNASANGFKKFLISNEEDPPLWYLISDLYLTALGAFCFYMTVCEPRVADRYHLAEVEDVINVNFLMKFLLLFWAHGFNSVWLATGRAALDLASCLPVLSIPARIFGGATVEKTIDLLQLARFLRLLGDSLPSSARSMRPRRRDVDQSILQTTTVQTQKLLFALSGTIALSATLLLLYENSPDRSGSLGRLSVFRTFEDAVLYMVNVFAGRDPPFYAQTSGGKQVTVAATLASIIFVPFLISSTVDVFMGPNAFKGGSVSGDRSPPTPVQALTFVSPAITSGPAYWAGVLWRIDTLEAFGHVSNQEANDLRVLAVAEDPQVQVLDLRYGSTCLKVGENEGAWELYALRLKQWLSANAVSTISP